MSSGEQLCVRIPEHEAHVKDWTAASCRVIVSRVFGLSYYRVVTVY